MEVIATLRQNIVNMSEEAEGLKQDYKLKKAKAKYLKRQLKETDEQKQVWILFQLLKKKSKKIKLLKQKKLTFSKSTLKAWVWCSKVIVVPLRTL